MDSFLSKSFHESPSDVQALYPLFLRIYLHPDSFPFLSPVDYKGLGLTDYLQVIKRPMDFGTIKKNFEQGKYENMESAADDIILVFENCILYNSQGSNLNSLAISMLDAFQISYQNLSSYKRKLKDEKENLFAYYRRQSTLDERISLSHDLYRLPLEQLNLILDHIQEHCPMALVQNAATNEVAVNIDILSTPLFHEINLYVLSFLSQKNNKNLVNTGPLSMINLTPNPIKTNTGNSKKK